MQTGSADVTLTSARPAGSALGHGARVTALRVFPLWWFVRAGALWCSARVVPSGTALVAGLRM